MAVSSYIELKRGGREAEWPVRREEQVSGYELGLDALAAATTKDEESATRELFTSASRTPSVRPLTFARERDARIVRKDVNGSISVVLNILTAKDEKARQMSMVEGIDACTGEALKTATRRRSGPRSFYQKQVTGRATSGLDWSWRVSLS